MGDSKGQDDGTHAYIRYDKVRVPLDAMLGGPGEGFKVAESRLGGGRVHHAMRTVGKCQRPNDIMLMREVSRRTQARPPREHPYVHGAIACSRIQSRQFSLSTGTAACRGSAVQ